MNYVFLRGKALIDMFFFINLKCVIPNDVSAQNCNRNEETGKNKL